MLYRNAVRLNCCLNRALTVWSIVRTLRIVFRSLLNQSIIHSLLLKYLWTKESQNRVDFTWVLSLERQPSFYNTLAQCVLCCIWNNRKGNRKNTNICIILLPPYIISAPSQGKDLIFSLTSEGVGSSPGWPRALRKQHYHVYSKLQMKEQSKINQVHG